MDVISMIEGPSADIPDNSWPENNERTFDRQGSESVDFEKSSERNH